MIVLDSSFIVAFFNEGDSNHADALERMKVWEAQRTGFLVCDYVALEVSTVILLKVSLEKATLFLDFIRDSENIRFIMFDYRDFNAAIGLFSGQQHRMSFADAAVVHLALSTNSDLATFDSSQGEEYTRLKTAKSARGNV